LVAKEYISQTLLAQFEISYEFDSEVLAAWQIAGVYQNTASSPEEVNVVAKIEGKELNLTIKLN
jgi:hypothetical protein